MALFESGALKTALPGPDAKGFETALIRQLAAA
jgi:DNA topoisomerase-1